MSVKEDKVNLVVTINADKARKELFALDTEARKLKEEMRGLSKESTEYADKSKRLGEVKARMAELRSEIGLSAKTLKELNQELRGLMATRNYLTPGTEAFAQNEAAIKAVRSRITELNAGISQTGGVMRMIQGEIRQFGLIAATYLGFQFLSESIAGIISRAGKLSDQLADIQKTTGMSADEVERLNAALSKIDTRTSTSELRGMAIVAGQMGIAQKDVLGFVEAIDKANVALGDEFGVGAEQIADILGRLRMVFTDVKSEQVDVDLLHISNALNALGASGSATSPVVAQFANRIGGVAISMGMTTGQVLGLSATLQELNVRTERGGTAIVKILQRMTTNTAEFAKVANMDIASFTHLVNTNLFEALQAVARGTAQGGASAIAFGHILKDLNVDGAGASEVISKLAGNLPMLQSRVELASNAIANTNSITDEFNIKNQNLGAQLDKLGKEFARLTSSSSVREFLIRQVVNLREFIEQLKSLPEFLAENARSIRLLGMAFVAYNASLIASTASSVLNTTVTLARNAAYEISYRWLLLKEAATKAYALATGVLSGQITLAAAAQRAWNAAAALNPFGLVLAAVVALVEAVDLYRSNTAAAVAAERQRLSLSRELKNVQDDLTLSNQQYAAQLQKINQLSPQQRLELEKTIHAKLRDAEASLLQLQAQQKQVQQSATQVGTWQAIYNSIANVGNPVAASIDNATDALNNGRQAAEKYNEPLQALQKSIEQLRGSQSQITDINRAFDAAMRINTETTEQYNEKLKLLRTALSNAVIGSAEYRKIQEEITRTQKALNASTQEAEYVDKEKVQEGISALQELRSEIAKLEASLLQDEQGRYRREIDAVNEKYATLLAKAAGHHAEEQRLRELRAREIQAIEERANRSISELQEQLLLSRQSKEEQEIQAIRNKYQRRIEDFAGFQEQIRQLEEMRDAEIAAKEQEYATRRITDQVALQDEIFLLSLSDNDRELAEEMRKWDTLIEQAQTAGLDTENLYRMQHTAITALIQTQKQRELKATQEANKRIVDAERKRWQTTYEMTNTFLKGIGSLLSLFGAKQATMIEFEKMVTFAQIAIDSAGAISAVTARNAKTSASPIDYAIKVAAAIVTVLANMAKAKSMLSSANPPSAPAFRQGGRLPGGTVLPGPATSDDNLLVVDPATGQTVARIKSGEPVLSTETYANNKPIVDALLHASTQQGGASILRSFNTGGIIDASLTVPLQPDINSLLQGLSVTRSSAVQGNAQGSPSVDIARLTQEAVARALSDNREASQAFFQNMLARLEQLEVKGVWDWDYYERSSQRISQVRAGSTLGD